MKNITFPDNWENPKYYLGQRVKQGEIIGVEYYPERSRASLKYGSGWRYSLMRNSLDDAEKIRYFNESEIELLITSELRAEIQEDIDFYTQQLAALKVQLEDLSGEQC